MQVIAITQRISWLRFQKHQASRRSLMGSRYEVEVTVGSASNLKNVNWRNGELRPYAVLWVDDGPKCSTRVDIDNGGEDGAAAVWEEKLAVPVPPASRLHDAVLCIDVVHAANADDDELKPLVGSARLPLRDVLDDAGVGGGKVSRTLRLKRPSGRPQGRIDVRVAVREAYAGAAAGSRDPYYAGAAAQPYAAGYPAAAGYGAPPPAYGAPPPYYGGGAPPPAAAPYYGVGAPPAAAAPAKSGGSKMGMGTGLAVGAAAGVLGGLALAEGASYLEDKFEDHVAEKVEEDLYADDAGGDYDDDY